MKNRKTIGVIVGRPDEPFQTKFLRSVGREAFKYDMDVLVFSNMLRTGGYTDYQLGEERIMELVNYDMLAPRAPPAPLPAGTPKGGSHCEDVP